MSEQSEAAFARSATEESYGQKGISQRRLLAGMICSGMMGGIVGMPDQQWKQEQIKIVVSVGVCIADEIIKQTEET